MKKNMFLVAAGIFVSSQLTAQQQQDTTSKQLDEVVVTSIKQPMKTSATGKVVTVITKQQLERSGGKDLSQVLNEQAGIIINGANSNPGKDKNVYTLGARTDYTLITIDGVPVYDASGIGSNFDLRMLSVDLIERIEIVRGSQSVLYGSDAIAGVINIITKKPGNKKLNINGVAGYGSFNTLRGNLSLNGKANKLDYTIGYTGFTNKGISEARDTTAAKQFDKDGYTQHSIQAKLGIQATKQLRIIPYLRFTNFKGAIDAGAFTDELDFTSTLKNLQTGFRTELKTGAVQFNLLYNYNQTQREFIDDSVRSRNGFDDYSRGWYKANEHFADVFATTTINNLFKLTGGIDFRSAVSNQEYQSISAFPFSNKYSGDSLKQTQTGIYAALHITSKENISLEAGGRMNFHSVFGNNLVANFNPSWLVQKQVKLFANLATGFKAPTLYQTFSEYGNRSLKPEQSLTFETGVQYFSKNNQFMARGMYFRRNVKNVIFFFTNTSTFASQFINQDRQKDGGVELEITYRINQLNVKAFYTYVNGNITTTTNGKDTSFNNLLRRPKHSLGFNAGYSITPKLYTSVNIQHFGKRNDAFFNTQTFGIVNKELKSYTLVDVYAEYRFLNNRLNVFADARNILNKNYEEAVGFSTMGFNLFGGVRFNF
jgi:vitamin B12 transporter